MEQLLENKINFWKNIKENKPINYSDIQQLLFAPEYIYALESFDFNYHGKTYNSELFSYEFSASEYSNYDEIFFQNYLDNVITKELYLGCEKAIINMINILNDNSPVYAYYSLFTDTLAENMPANKSKDVIINSDILNKNKEKIYKVSNKNLLKEICYLGLREIAEVYLFFSESKMVVIISACHGIILSKNPISDNLVKQLSKVLHLKPLSI